MEKIDILLIAILIFGAAAFFAIKWCFALSKITIDILTKIEDIYKYKDAILTLGKLGNSFQESFKTQNEFNKCCIDNINKVDAKLINVLKEIDKIKSEIGSSPSPTGGGEADAEP